MMPSISKRATSWFIDSGLDVLGVCTDGAQDLDPKGCQFPSARFIDGCYTDNNAFAILVGQMQQKHGVETRLRFVVHVSEHCISEDACNEMAARAADIYFDTSRYDTGNQQQKSIHTTTEQKQKQQEQQQLQ